MLLKLLRNGLGNLIIFVDYLTRPAKLERNSDDQNTVDQATQQLSLYQFRACPFCVKVRRNIHRLNLSIETRDAMNNPDYRSELAEQGGEIKVPCLRVEEKDEVKWIYESSDIIDYLDKRFGEEVKAG